MPDVPAPETPFGAKLVFGLLLVGMFAGAFFISPSQSFLERMPRDDAALPVEIPDFAEIADVTEKKQEFFNFLQPFIDAQNQRIQEQRESLLAITAKLERTGQLTHQDQTLLSELSEDYGVETDNIADDLDIVMELLLRRVDLLPPSLVLAQAANESAWGTSRFALEANNYFGQWCYSEGCGIVPSRRGASATHEVQAFDSIEAAVEAYFRNLNTFSSYRELRLIRESLRASSSPIDGISLSQGLESYSERGVEYISELQDMIRYNDLLELDLQLTQSQQN